MTNDRHILIKNIYYMLSYAFTVLNQSLDEKVDKEAFENIHNLFAAILSKGLGRQLKQGLYREYISVTDTMPLMRGKNQSSRNHARQDREKAGADLRLRRAFRQ